MRERLKRWRETLASIAHAAWQHRKYYFILLPAALIFVPLGVSLMLLERASAAGLKWISVFAEWCKSGSLRK